MKQLSFIIFLFSFSLISCKDNTDCGDYQIYVDNGQNGLGQSLSGCNNVGLVYAGNYIENFGQPNWTAFDIAAHSDVDKMWFNGFFYAIIDKDNLHSFVLPDQFYTVNGNQQHLLSGYGTCDGTTLTVHYVVYTNTGQTLTADFNGTRH